jgi:ABC-type transport system involved in cytochrome c biogenesis permease subunit
MRSSLLAIALFLGLGTSTVACAGEDNGFQWDQWRYLPVQEGGRHKPLDTLAWETMRGLCNRSRVTDPETGQKLNPHTFYLALLFDWQGWDKPRSEHVAESVHSRSAYSRLHKPDKWDRAPLLRVDFLALRTALGLGEDQKYVSPLDLTQSKIKIPKTYEEKPFLSWAEGLTKKQQEGHTVFEKKALELAGKFWSYQDHRMGRRLKILPVTGSEDQPWMSIASLMYAQFDDVTDPSGAIREAGQHFQQARAAYFASAPQEFNRASDAFLRKVRGLRPDLGAYPSPTAIDLEVGYNRWSPFRFAWVFMMISFVFMLLSMGTGWKPFYVGGWSAFTASLIVMAVGFALRVVISGRAPVTNMYESVIYLGLGVSLFGLIFEIIYRKQFVLTAAAAVATVALILADNCPAALDPSLRPLQPVLRSNFWLVTHVMTITLSYAAFALAMGIGNITLGCFLLGKAYRDTISGLTRFTYRAVQVGVLLLATGTILGGVWADYSWGRFWGWDPKEVWALIALLGYLAVLHARNAGLVKSFGLAALSVLCFSLVIMAWYGVNFVLGAGLHSYGFGGGGRAYVLTAVLLQAIFVLAAGIRFVGTAAPAPRVRLSSMAPAVGD